MRAQSEVWPILLALLFWGDKPSRRIVLNRAQLEALIWQVGLRSDDAMRIAPAIALAESGGRVNAVGDNGTSFGLWQIHLPTAPATYRNRERLLNDASFNASAMATISKEGTDWTPWTTYRNGKYLQFLTVAT